MRGDNGLYYRYGHLSKVGVTNGQRVKAGDTIGLSGNTGYSTGPHLHWQVQKDTNNTSDISPYSYITSALFQAKGDIGLPSYSSSDTEGTEDGSIKVQAKKFIPKSFSNDIGGGEDSAGRVVSSVDGGFNKLITYLEGIREENMNRQTVKYTDKYTAYIKNNLTNTIIPFISMPQGLTETIAANFTQQDIVGASKPRIVYNNTSAKTMNLSLQNLTEDYVAEGFTSLYEYVRAFQALAYPEYNAGIVKSPDLTLVLGDRSMSCVCTNVSVTWGELVKENQITSCNIDLVLLMTRENVPGATWIMTSG